MTDTPRSKLVPLSRLNPHPRNYRNHPEDQIEHLIQSIREHGIYRNIVAGNGAGKNDLTILAGHGVVEALRRLGHEKAPTVHLPIDPDSPQALKILAADNYLSYFSDDDDRALTEILREIAESDTLLGTGFDDQTLAALLMVTRPASEIADFDAAAEWVGMPEFEHDVRYFKLIINCETEEDRDAIAKKIGVREYARKRESAWSAYFPPRPMDDVKNVIFE